MGLGLGYGLTMDAVERRALNPVIERDVVQERYGELVDENRNNIEFFTDDVELQAYFYDLKKKSTRGYSALGWLHLLVGVCRFDNYDTNFFKENFTEKQLEQMKEVAKKCANVYALGYDAYKAYLNGERPFVGEVK